MQERRQIDAFLWIVMEGIGIRVAFDPGCRLVQAVAPKVQLTGDHQFVRLLAKGQQCHRVSKSIERPVHVWARRDHQAGTKDPHVVPITRSDHQAMRPESYEAIISVARSVMDVECSHRGVTRGMKVSREPRWPEIRRGGEKTVGVLRGMRRSTGPIILSRHPGCRAMTSNDPKALQKEQP